MLKSLKEIQELKIKNSIEILSDFLSTTNRNIKQIQLIEYQQFLWTQITKLNDTTKKQQDANISEINQIRI